MKLETSESVDILLHGYALGSRYDGTAVAAVLFILLWTSAIGAWLWYHHQDYFSTLPFKSVARDTAEIRDMLRGQSATVSDSSYFYGSSSSSSSSCGSRLRRVPKGNICSQSKIRSSSHVDPSLPSFGNPAPPPQPEDHRTSPVAPEESDHNEK